MKVAVIAPFVYIPFDVISPNDGVAYQWDFFGGMG